MPPSLSPKQIAFDTAVKARKNALYLGIANLDEFRDHTELAPFIDQLIEIRQSFNDALAVEGQHIIGDSPHAPLYLDFVASPTSNALAFKDDDHSFIGITMPLVFEVTNISHMLAHTDSVVAGIGLPSQTDRQALKVLLFWMLFGFVVSHELAHHTHGHLGGAVDIEEIAGGAVTGNLQRQAWEADADGWAAYLTLAHWVTAGGRPALVQLLNLENAVASVQDDVAFACFVVVQAAFTFLREPEPLTKDSVYWRTHPPQPVRLHLMSRYVLKFSAEFREGVRETLTQPRYHSLMDIVSQLLWTNGKHAELWHSQQEFLKTPDGVAYRDALITELDAFRATLREREVEALSRTAVL